MNLGVEGEAAVTSADASRQKRAAQVVNTDPATRPLRDASRIAPWLPFADVAAMSSAFIFAIVVCGYAHMKIAEYMAPVTYFAAFCVSSQALFYSQKIYNFIPRYFGHHEAESILKALVLSIAVGCLAAFLVHRLDTVARTVIITHGFLTYSVMVGLRWIMRLRDSRALKLAAWEEVVNVLVVGINPVASLYIDAVGLLGQPFIRVAGVLSERPAVSARHIRGHRILGAVRDVADIMATLKNHGVPVHRVVVTISQQGLSARDAELLREISAGQGVEIEYLTQILNIPIPEREYVGETHFTWEGRFYPILRRAADIVAAALLLIVCSPILLVTAIMVMTDVGNPVVFWQERPGRFGVVFKIYKFRTMSAPVDRWGRPVADDQRTGRIGAFVRRYRLDELLQLVNVLSGAMSLVGPRPLLVSDQPADARKRLSVRPGLTGWAQVQGGQTLSKEEKAKLDVWYTEHASLLLDLKILLLTVRMLILGDARSVYRSGRSATDRPTELVSESLSE